jgi:pyruvate dehydrogenase E2 component (dihydrolipoamide acetyltransferase)
LNWNLTKYGLEKQIGNFDEVERTVSATIEIKVPDIGDFSDIPVIEVLVAEGDQVSAEDSLVTLESDKATMEVPSPEAGVIRELKLKLNDTVSEGDVVAVLEVAEAESADEAVAEDHSAAPEEDDSAEPEKESEPATPAPAKSAPATSQAVVSGPAAVDPSSVPYASPAIRRFARELGADLTRVKGTGKGSRILRDDVAAFIKSELTGPASGSRAATGGSGGFNFPPFAKVDFSRFGTVTEQPLSRIGKLSAGFLHRNWVSIPHVTQNDEADVTEMEAFRKAHASVAEAQGFKLTPLVFLIKATVMALKKFPQFNSSLDQEGENLILKSYFNIGIAVDTPEGLVVPVLRECDDKGMMELARELGQLSARAREQKLKPQDIQGGCFSISSLGGIGGTSFTPIINAPEVAIMGVSRSKMKPVWDGEQFQPRLMMPLSVSYDHRVIDGAAAARFTRYLASQLEDLRRMTL